MTNEISFLDSLSGAGLDSITTNEQAIPYLGLVQPDSEAAQAGAAPGTWRNSATGTSYGNVVTVVPLDFKVIWSERDPNPPFATVGRYLPNTIEVEIQQPKNGKGYPKRINPKTGNEVQELYVYAVMLPEHPEDGILLFNPTVSSMRACKTWNTQLAQQLLKSGARAPIFANIWNLACDLVENPAKKGAKMAKFVKAEKVALIDEKLFKESIEPKLPTVSQTVLSIADQTESND